MCLLFSFFRISRCPFPYLWRHSSMTSNMCHVIFHVWGVSWRKILYFQQYISEKSSNISRKLLSLLVGVTKVDFMWCVFHNAQWYWSDNLCKLVTDQWRASLGVRDSESCWFTEEMCTYMRCWESPGDLPLVIEIVVSFRSFRCAPLAKRHKISITRGRSPGLSQERM